MKRIKTKFSDVMIIEPHVHSDHRGFFMESYNQQLFEEYGLNDKFVQDNHSLSGPAGTLRGLHYQIAPKAQTKLVRVTSGAVYDVVVDIRRGSPTYGEWVGVILSEANKRQLLVPKGYAHGFCTLVKNTEVQYKVDAYYSPEHERGILWKDSKIGIDWPTDNPILSDKDQQHPLLAHIETNFNLEVDSLL